MSLHASRYIANPPDPEKWDGSEHLNKKASLALSVPETPGLVLTGSKQMRPFTASKPAKMWRREKRG